MPSVSSLPLQRQHLQVGVPDAHGAPQTLVLALMVSWLRTLQTCFQQEDHFWQGQVALRKGLGEGFSLPPHLSMESEEGHSHPLPGAAGGPAST